MAASLTLSLGMAGEASAQGWSHEGVSFPGRDNWCAKTTQQDDGQGNVTPALELRPCGLEFPFLSVGVAARGMEPLDLAVLTAQAADVTLGPDGEATTTAIFRKQDAGCTKISRTISRDPIAGVSSFDLFAQYACPALSAEPTVMRNFTSYAQRGNGDVWVVAFDHPDGDITDADKTMIRSAIAAIQSR
jgi:hypothetical protein